MTRETSMTCRIDRLLTGDGQTVLRISGRIGGDDVDVLRVFISQLRRKIEQDPGRPKIIATDPGIGYRWLLRPAEDPATTRH